MSLQLYRHPITDQAETYYIDRLKAGIQNKKEWIILVPDHIKFESEKQIIQRLSEDSISASFNIKVLSISRFIWYLLRGNPILEKILPAKSLMNMLMAKALTACQNDLRVLKRSAQYPTFVRSLVELYQEFYKGQIDLANLEKLGNGKSFLLSEKLHDLQMIFRYYEEHLPNVIAQQDQLMQAAKEQMKLTEQGIERVIVSHFYQFSSMEEDFILSLAEVLPVDLYIAHQEDQGAIEKSHPHFSAFYPSYRSLDRLKRLAHERSIPLTVYDLLARKSDSLVQLIQGFISNKFLRVKTSALAISSFNQAKHELRAIFKEIRRLVKEEKVRYRDIILVTRHLEDYRQLAMELAIQYHIPLFIDQAEKMVDHPLNQLILGLEKMCRPYYTGKDLIHCLRSGLFSLDTYTPGSEEWLRQIDHLDNVLLAFGVDSFHPLLLEDPAQDEDLANILTDMSPEERKKLYDDYQAIRQIFDDFRQQLTARNNLSDMAKVFYQWCETYQVREWCNAWREWSIESGDLERAKHDEQAWDLLIHLLDEMAEYGQEGKLEAHHFFQLLKMAFQESTYQLIPSRIDGLSLTNLDAIQFGQYSYGFFFGLSDDVLPSGQSQKSLLDHKDRDIIKEHLTAQQQLKDLKTDQLASESYKFALALSHINKKIFLSYHEEKIDGTILRPSPYLSHLESLVDGAVDNLRDTIDNFLDQGDILDWVLENPKNLPQLLKLLPKGPLLDRLKSLERSKEWTNLPENIGSDLAHQIYGNRLKMSVTQLESYFMDPFAYFLTYGLKLKERPIFALDALKRGSLFHDSLKNVYDQIENWQSDNHQKLVDTINRYLNQEENLLVRAYQRTAYSKFLLEQIRHSLLSLVRVQDLQQKSFIPHAIYTEKSFGTGDKDSLPGLSLHLSGSDQLILRGRIDRVDRFQVNQDSYLLVTDYKSSPKDLRLSDLVQGLNLQLIAYMDVLLHQDQKAYFLGAVYSPLQYPFVLHQKEMSEEMRERQSLAEIRPKGFVLADPDLLKAVNPGTDVGQSSLSLPFRLTNTGSLNQQQKASLLSLEDFSLIRDYSLYLMKNAGLDILSGQIKMQPLKEQTFVDTIATGKYFPISLFDPSQMGNRYRLIDRQAKDDPLKFMKSCLERGDSHD
ncbi:hypothetical protein D3H64_05245 [Atopobacter sp. AH10]|uniref:PD-(D/E)XK nuclease family protein n=1 Tax=Atopobacter sp. AH10 TaxID=2315861 RepID=UPI000EF2226A|nr:PD-(D/E)XK nuclease family protein [Atopobacter sp. AH10]RLK63191.1 hypothetical protein D3H64_05245 [Atopobacter sp. AH10]